MSNSPKIPGWVWIPILLVSVLIANWVFETEKVSTPQTTPIANNLPTPNASPQQVGLRSEYRFSYNSPTPNASSPLEKIESLYSSLEWPYLDIEDYERVINGLKNIQQNESVSDPRVKKRIDEILPRLTAELSRLKTKWQRSKAGKICAKHPAWSRDDCIRISGGNVWIGMEVDMLVAQRGRPNSVNVSNYGRGERYQYCWHYWTPMCVYDDNGDGKIESYN